MENNILTGFTGDYHTHTYMSDGSSSAEQNVLEAISKGLKEIAITDHGFGNPKRFAMTEEKFDEQRKQLEILRAEHGDKITIYHGIEADLIGEDGTIDLSEKQMAELDVLVMGFHSFAKPKSFRDWRRIYWNAYLRAIKYPPKSVIARNTKALIRAIKRYPIDILAHPGHLFKVDCVEVAKAAGDYGVLMELNAKHFNYSHELFEKMLTTSANFVVNSDAHFYKLVGGFSQIEQFLSQHSFDPSRIVNLGGRPAFKKK
ncbi:MAG: PHP domain-containing protein [Clostridiales bacterium]|jgi:putative hydrolase|nr:PHP domain-containing protein [Clostridiales bacterium]